MESNNEAKNDAFMVIFEVLESNESSENWPDRLASSSFLSLVHPTFSCTFSRICILINISWHKYVLQYTCSEAKSRRRLYVIGLFGYLTNETKRSHTKLDSRRQVIAI